MTLVLTCKFWRSLAVIADCRVSYEPFLPHVDDCLQKLYHINNRLVIGFSGPLDGAYEILKLVRENTERYKHPVIANNISTDIERWIRYKYKRLKSEHRKGLSFLIASIEPSRKKKSRFVSQNGEDIQPPKWYSAESEWHTYALIPAKSGELIKVEKQFIKIIGKACEFRTSLEETIKKLYSFSFNKPLLQLQAVMGSLAYEILKSPAKKYIGGLFQCALLNENGVQWLGYAGENVTLEFQRDRFQQINTLSGKAQPLLTIWEWARIRPKPGSFGPFDDPSLSQAIQNHDNNV